MALGEIQTLQAREQARADAYEGTSTSTVVGLNNMPPRRTSATTTRAVVAARAATAMADAPMTSATVEQLIETRFSMALANHETL
ncbi:hypothetical protein Tco_1341730 [Tanacetum coccineum]